MEKTIDAKAFEAYVQKALKLSTEEMASLYNEAGELTDFSTLEKKDAERISKLSTDKTNQYNRGLKEGASKLENALKEKYEVESELIGVELFDHIIESKVTDVEKANPEEVLKHPAVIKALNEKDRMLKAKDKEIEDKLKAKEEEINESTIMKEVESFGLLEFEALNPILPADVKKAKAQRDFFLSKFKEGKKFQKTKDGFIVKDSEGNPIKDEHGYDITFNDYVKGTAGNIFDFKVAEDRNSPGLKTPDGVVSKKVRTPINRDDFVKMQQDNTLTSAERIEIRDLAQQAKII